jgi:hypothetical protein
MPKAKDIFSKICFKVHLNLTEGKQQEQVIIFTMTMQCVTES